MVYSGIENDQFERLRVEFRLIGKEDSMANKSELAGIHISDGYRLLVDEKFYYLKWEPINFKLQGNCRRFQREICRYYRKKDGYIGGWEGHILPLLKPFLGQLRTEYPFHFIIVKEIISFGPLSRQHIHCDGKAVGSFTFLTGVYPDGVCRVLRPLPGTGWDYESDSGGEFDCIEIGLHEAFLWDGLWAHCGSSFEGLHRRVFFWVVNQDHYPIYDVYLSSEAFT